MQIGNRAAKCPATHQHNSDSHAEQGELVALEARVLPDMVRRQAVKTDRPATSAVALCRLRHGIRHTRLLGEQLGLCTGCLSAVCPCCAGWQPLHARPCASSNLKRLQQSIICDTKHRCQCSPRLVSASAPAAAQAEPTIL